MRSLRHLAETQVNCRSSQSRADVKQSIHAAFLVAYGFLLPSLLVIAFLPQIELSSHEELPTNTDPVDRPETGANGYFACFLVD
jgi:hypothetical protein